MENPGYSLPSKLFSCVSIGVVLASIAAMCIHSLPEYQAREAAAAVAAVAAGRSPEGVRDDPVTPQFFPGESPWTEEPGRLQSMGLQRVGYD